jgi:hypothetical protein
MRKEKKNGEKKIPYEENKFMCNYKKIKGKIIILAT